MSPSRRTRSSNLLGVVVIIAVAAVVIAIFALIRQTDDTNYSGSGQEFSLIASVDHPGESSVTAIVDSIQEAHGKAAKWFNIGKNHQFHDTCWCESGGRGPKQYGHVYDRQGHEVALDALQPGQMVRITGAIRSSRVTGSILDQPIFDSVTMIGG